MNLMRFLFQDVSNARLAQRRKNKKSSTDARSHSSTSSLSSTSSASSLNSTCTPSKSDRCSSSLGVTPKKEESIFDFGEARVKAYLSSIESPSEKSFPATPSMVLTLPSPRSKSTSKSSGLGSFELPKESSGLGSFDLPKESSVLGSFELPKENTSGETLTKPDNDISVSSEESSFSASKVSYNKEQCLAFKKESAGCDMEEDILNIKCSGSSQKFFPCDSYFTGPQTRSRKRKLEKLSEGDVTIVKHMFKGRNTRSKRFDTIVIDWWVRNF